MKEKTRLAKMMSKQDHKLSILIVSYNTCEMTLACIQSVFDETKETNFEVIIVDNASSDNSAEEIANKYGDEVKLIRLEDNIGFAAGNNLAAKSASGDYLLLLNPDTVVLKNAIDNLMSFSQENINSKIWGGKTLNRDKTLNPTSCWRKVTLWNLICRAFGLSKVFKNSPIFNSEEYGGWKRDTIKNVDIVTGCFLLIERALWDRLGGFDKDFFMYAEDADLCLRAIKLNATPLICPEAEIIHYGGASERVKEDKIIKLLKAKHLLIKKHWWFLKYKLGRIIIMLYPFNSMFIKKIMSSVNKKYKEEYVVWKGIWERRKEWLDV